MYLAKNYTENSGVLFLVKSNEQLEWDLTVKHFAPVCPIVPPEVPARGLLVFNPPDLYSGDTYHWISEGGSNKSRV